MTVARVPPAAKALPLAARLRARWLERGWPGAGTRVAVACSGGVDSLSLLHLLRFPLRDLGLELSAAHFDHRMRGGSAEEAAWIRGVTRAWGIPLHMERAVRTPRGEAAAREARYGFLTGLVRSGEVAFVLTGHQADDQIETVLFRILRGTGVGGLVGIPECRPPGILRPLLPFRREEIQVYASEHALRPRHDPSNTSPAFVRNRIRHELIPLAESIRPGARAGVLRLTRNASEAARALESLLAERLEELTSPSEGEEEGTLSLRREAFLAQKSEVQRALVRMAARRVGATLTRSGTATALQFMRRGSSGRVSELPGGVLLVREFDRVRFALRDSEPSHPSGPPERTLEIPANPSRGEATCRIGGREFRVHWGPPSASPATWSTSFDAARLAFPLTLRGWVPGDRTRTTGGGRKVKKLLGERRIPVTERHRLPLLVDGEGEVLWIPGVHRAPQALEAEASGTRWHVEVSVDDRR